MPLGSDRLFHLRIAEATGNSALALVVQTLWDQRTGPLFLRLEHHFDTPALWTVAISEHREIVAAIARHDAGRRARGDAPPHEPRRQALQHELGQAAKKGQG